MEERRRQLMQNSDFYPQLAQLGPPRVATSRPREIISIGSSNSSAPSIVDSEDENFRGIPSKTQNKPRPHAAPFGSHNTIDDDDDAAAAVHHPVHKAKRNIVLSDDEEDDVQVIPAPRPTSNQAESSGFRSSGAPVPVHIPSNRDLPPAAVVATQYPLESRPTGNSGGEYFDADVNQFYDPGKSRAEAEKDLQNLFQDSMNDTSEDIDMEEAKVEGFRDEITLLPHQVLGARWMKERETGKKTGGILADDMGLGKTVQALVRIVTGRPKKSDKAEGWAASTLVVCPTSLVSQWAAEVRRIAQGLRVIEHHGASRTADPEVLHRAHIVVTSYAVAASEHGSYSPAKDESKIKTKGKGRKKDDSDASASDSDDSDSSAEHFGRTLATKKKPTAKKVKDALFHVKWFRIFLDEAHNIKNRNTKTAQACFELKSKFRWCLTGTPMQNGVEELFSYFKFLGIRPLNEWQTFNEQISKPVKAGRSVRAMKRLQVVLKAIMLRRRKDILLNGKPLIELPARILTIVKCHFTEEEREFYNAVEKRIEETLQKFIRNGEVGKYTSVMVLLLRLRQACNHAMLISKDYANDQDALAPQPASSKDDDDDGLADMLAGLGVSDSGRKCQMCQTALDDDETETHCAKCLSIAAVARRKSIHGSNDLPPHSAKTREILKILREIDDRSDGVEKTIIFSQFTSMLDIIQLFLKAEGISYVRYDGSMTKDKREASIEKIKSSKTTNVILISFKAGGVGLNLTACNNVILVDLWWNPALEDQAFDRAHRFGQKRDVNIFKLTIPETVEDRILLLQDKKRELAAAALSGDKIKKNKLGMDELMALFRPGGRDDDEDED